MFEICLFDLDDTLLRTEDLKTVREAGKNNNEPAYSKEVRAGLDSEVDRHIYSLEVLEKIRSEFPKLILGVFTRSPRSYAKTVLKWAYPTFKWDIVVAYEDVERTKPYGDGIDRAMEKFGVNYLDRVILVGDNDVDVRSAYHCGCIVALDKGAWPFKWRSEHWRALERVPDAIIDSPEELLEVLASPDGFLPEVERALAGASPKGSPRFDRIGHFVAKAAGGDSTSYPIYVCGRSFANYDSVKYRKQWHELTGSIEENKEADAFPDEWIKTVRRFIASQYSLLFGSTNINVSVIPHRPGRKPRLESFLAQLKASVGAEPIKGRTVSCHPKLLAYKGGVKSQHNDLLSRDARFINVRDHLIVQQPELIKPKTGFLIIDDVATTGASLIYAYKYLKEAGADDVKCLSMAKNIGKIL